MAARKSCGNKRINAADAVMRGKRGARGLIRTLLQLLPMLLTLPASALASGGALQFTQWQSTAFDNDANSDTIERREFALSLHWQRERDQHTLSYRHQPLLIRSGTPASNGYLHQLDWQLHKQADAYHWLIRVGVHGSSNMFKHTDFHSDAVVASFNGYGELRNSPASPGIAGDYRFGRFLIYPRLHIPLPLGNTVVEADLPVALHWREANHRWRVGIERYGEKWGTLDADRRVRDKLYLSEWRFGGRMQIPAQWASGQLEIGAGISVASKVRYRDLEQGRRREKLDDSVYGSLAWRW